MPRPYGKHHLGKTGPNAKERLFELNMIVLSSAEAKKLSRLFSIVGLLCVLLLVAACSAQRAPASTATSVSIVSTPLPQTQSETQAPTQPPAQPSTESPTQVPQAANVVAEETAKPEAPPVLLVWLDSGTAPGQQTPQQPGQLILMGADGGTTPLLDIPASSSRVAPCGLSPDSATLAFYVGEDSGALYLQKGKDTPVKLDDVQALTCMGAGQTQFSPDGSRVGYIAYEAGAAQNEFADGFLRVVDTAAKRLLDAEKVTAFDMTADGAVYLSLFTNDKKEADEAAITTWNGSAKKEVVTLTPSESGCRFVSGQIAVASDGRFVTVMGQRCKTGDARTQWQVYLITPADGSATLAASDFQVGAFAPFARTNNIFFSLDGSHALFTIPDGVTTYTVGMKLVNLADLSVSDVIDRQAVMPSFSGAPNVYPQFSPDGRWLALVVTTPNNENTLTILDLSNPTMAPITLPGGSRGDVFSAMAFTADSKRLVTVMGASDSGDNSLFSVDLTSGSSSRVARGRFGSALAVSSAGLIAVPEWQIPDDPKQPAYLNTIVINPATGETATWFTGADVTGGKVTNARFALPLAWR